MVSALQKGVANEASSDTPYVHQILYLRLHRVILVLKRIITLCIPSFGHWFVILSISAAKPSLCPSVDDSKQILARREREM
jgi:hypothetical protein